MAQQNPLLSKVATIRPPAHHPNKLPTARHPHRASTAPTSNPLLPKGTVSLRRHSLMAPRPRARTGHRPRVHMAPLPRVPTAHNPRLPTAPRLPGRLPANSNIRPRSSLRMVRRPSSHMARHRRRAPTPQRHTASSNLHTGNRRLRRIPATPLPNRATTPPPLRPRAMAPRRSSSGTLMPTPTPCGQP